eukprot:jgi/Mesvir1/24871/Mv22104-RA.1
MAMGSTIVSDYEKQRESKMQENLQRMRELGLEEASARLSAAARATKRPRPNAAVSNHIPVSVERRKSRRLEGQPTVSYSELSDREILAGEASRSKWQPRQVPCGAQPEEYGPEHIALLGNAKEEWELMVDGYNPDGTRIYDPVNGKTCHQCRQKTLGLRTECSECRSLQGCFCGDCIYMRYGENVKEILAAATWVCPVCRDICNCSICRPRKKGWPATGQLYKTALSAGYPSVAHYLIHTKQRDQPAEGAENAVPAPAQGSDAACPAPPEPAGVTAATDKPASTTAVRESSLRATAARSRQSDLLDAAADPAVNSAEETTAPPSSPLSSAAAAPARVRTSGRTRASTLDETMRKVKGSRPDVIKSSGKKESASKFVRSVSPVATRLRKLVAALGKQTGNL